MTTHSDMDSKTPKLLILRGAPGSGKTTICKHKFKSWVRTSADDYFIDSNGNYKFDPKLLQDAHDKCFNRTVTAIETGKNVVVDNTNRALNEFKRYLAIPSCEIKIYRVTSQFKSEKSIPSHIMTKHLNEYEPHKDEKKIRLLINPDGTSELQFMNPKP